MLSSLISIHVPMSPISIPAQIFRSRHRWRAGKPPARSSSVVGRETGSTPTTRRAFEAFNKENSLNQKYTAASEPDLLSTGGQSRQGSIHESSDPSPR
ncbi:hypothetical protein M5K25_008199 [Dendrobium thyrsiflorum]|uniref:Uncharacterized protein n=1 Tax=Dendrobium thyrsiflorum TaxID=117978 RepID=A0ABD0V871_DENTH